MSKIIYDKYITALAKRREPSPIRALMPLLKIPGMISLGGGLPNNEMFPFESLSFKLKSGDELILTSNELDDALQYSPTPGIPILVEQIKQLQQLEHSPKYNDWSINITGGSQDGITKTIEALVEPNDSILIEDPTYSGVLSFLQPYGCQLLTIKTDEYGIIPQSLNNILENCDQNNIKKPKVLYTIPTGHNPSGSTITTDRKLEVLKIAKKYDLLILEDDPYYYLNYGPNQAPNDSNQFIRPIINSYFELDNDARVIRFDSLSKVLSSGLRIGFITGPTEIINYVSLHTQATNLHPSGVSQAIVSKLLKHWSLDGFQKHVNECCVYYQKRRDIMNSLANKHLNSLASWKSPVAGMFMWFKVLNNQIQDTKELIEVGGKAEKFLMVPGNAFTANGVSSPYVRASFSTASTEEMDTALNRFANILKKYN